MSELPTSMLMTGEEFIACMQSGAISSWPFYQRNPNIREDEAFWMMRRWGGRNDEAKKAVIDRLGKDTEVLKRLIFPSMSWGEIMRRDAGR